MEYSFSLKNTRYLFDNLRVLMAKATLFRSGDALAKIAASTNEERVAAQYALSEVPLANFLNEDLIPYEKDEITRLIIDDHDKEAFEPISDLTVGEFRDWLLSDYATTATLTRLGPGLTPEMVAAVSKIMRNQDLIKVAHKCEVISRFRTTVGLKGTLSVRLQPNNPVDNKTGIAASIVDGLMYGCGDAVIGINPATDSPQIVADLLRMVDDIRLQYEIPTQSCVLSHVTTTLDIIHKAPVDLVFQSIGGSELTNSSFGVNLSILQEAEDAATSLNRGTVGNQVMYFETGQGSALSANAHWGVDQQTCETRAYAVARKFNPFLVNTVVGFIGPEYLYDGKQIIRAALEDHFCGKLMGLPMGVDVCYTNHTNADQDDMDNLMTLLGVAGVNFIIGVPGSDDIMLNYQSASFHDAMYLRSVLDRKPSPEFEQWLQTMGIFDGRGNRQIMNGTNKLLENL
ncbi:ethanolamine ammonia-lyase subunit EutB [Mangrovibacterium diazotrophicum]|uniref:Ethanolamine ammonia-lyase large subunit n=1 Tax=Mangrovibacterium diazotrophicum TaxID=1261403 RepID=A0A419VYN7_9BACT|nr:ethanolamine ammonia-lyase subunit EutB [Mangrovibacterium diazotrophicum]RKD88269.1 ethanolamine ammonia-lyase heavy chain [Mangrovibacterium diazotrophicum]